MTLNTDRAIPSPRRLCHWRISAVSRFLHAEIPLARLTSRDTHYRCVGPPSPPADNFKIWKQEVQQFSYMSNKTLPIASFRRSKQSVYRTIFKNVGKASYYKILKKSSRPFSRRFFLVSPHVYLLTPPLNSLYNPTGSWIGAGTMTLPIDASTYRRAGGGGSLEIRRLHYTIWRTSIDRPALAQVLLRRDTNVRV